jgi:phosphate-selective porin
MVLSLAVPNMASAGVLVGQKGDMDLNIGAILQAGYTYHMEDTLNVDGFWMKRARLLFSGTIIPDKVKFFVQTDVTNDFSILDYKARFFYIPQTEIAFGRFLPNYTLYMPVSTAKLEMINYPVTTSAFATWRQVGIQTTTKTEYVDFNLGLFNGGDVIVGGENNMVDNNDAKDFLLRADFKVPLEGAKCRVGGYTWMGSAPATGFPEDETLGNNRYGGFAKLDYPINEMTLKIRGEFVMASTDWGDPDDPVEWKTQAYFAHAGLQVCPKIEVLARYEGIDPDTENDNDEHPGSEDDGMSCFTIGLNYYLDGLHSMIYLNYIHQMYAHEDIDSEGKIQAQVQIFI